MRNRTQGVRIKGAQGVKAREPKLGKFVYFHLSCSVPCYLLLVSCFLLLIEGCAKKLPPPLTPLSTPAKLSTGELYQLMEQRMAGFQNFRGIAKIRLVSENKKYRFTEVIVLEKPNLFRLETLGFLNQPALFIVSNGKSLSLYSKRDNQYYSGTASQANLFKLTGLNLAVEDVVRILSGNPPRLEKISSKQSRYFPDQKVYQLELISIRSQIRQLISLDATTNTFSQMESYRLPDGILLLKVIWEDYRSADGYPVPGKVTIDKPLDKTRIELTYQSFEVNQSLDGDLFYLKPPENVTVRLLDSPAEEPLEHLAPFKEFERPDGSE